MKSLIECLHDDEVGRLLNGELDTARTSEMERHLATCIDCRQRLEQQVGDDNWWSETESSLRREHVAPHVAASLQEAEDGRDFVSSLGQTRLRGKLLDLLGPTDDPNMLGRIGPYEIIGLLGQGGMGVVFKGFDRSLNRFVAIKMLLPHLAASGAARKRFAREGRAVAAVVDDHVMAIHCVDDWQGVPYLVMTYSRGVSLQKRLSDNGPLEVCEILRIGMQAAKGLAAAHAQGIVHRDIKPANIFLDQNVERVQLMDFGLARAVDDASLTRSGTLAGTPQYMSPEQARAETVDHRSDLFSLGSVLYALCTGHAPFRAESSYSVLRLITDKEPRPIREINPEIPVWLCTIIGKLMAKQASDRFDSAKVIAELLGDCLAHVQHPTAIELPRILVEHPLPISGSSQPVRLMRQFKRFGIRTWLLCGIGLAALSVSWMMLQDDPSNQSAQGERGLLTAAHPNLAELLKQQKSREESIRQISYQGTVRQYDQQDIQRTETESVDEFVARFLSLSPVYMDDKIPPYPLSASRDFGSGVYRFTRGDINAVTPKYSDWFIDKKKYVQLTGRDLGSCEAVVTNNREDIQDDREDSLVRLDIAAFQPVKDILMSEVLTKAIGEPGIPDVGGRPLWKLEPLDNNNGWKATFMFQHPVANPPGAKELLWYRVFWEQIGGELVIIRVDRLTVDGDENSTPQNVILIDDYRSVCGKPVPFRIRFFGLTNVSVYGTELLVSKLKINDYVDVPDDMQIPEGTRVRNRITGEKFNQPANKANDPTTDAARVQGTWDVVEMQQVGHEPNESEREFYKNGGYKITFTKNKMIHSPDHSSMQYRVDATQTPPIIQLSQSGNAGARAIYELNGDELKVCQGRKPENGVAPKAPASFDLSQAKPGEFPTLMILRRARPVEPVAIPHSALSPIASQPSAKNQGDAHDTGIANLTSLLERQRAREKAVRQLSMVGNIHQSQQIDTERAPSESNEDFIKRYTSQEINYDGLGPFPMTILRDYTADLGQFKFADLHGEMPILFREWFFQGDVFTQLMGVEQGHCQATITRKPADELRQPWSGWIRADVYAFRPILDHELSTILDKAAHTPGIPDPGGRPLFHLEKKESDDQKAIWIATFFHQEPSEVNGQTAVEQLWYRVFWEQVDEELLVTRVDELSVVGGANTMPLRIALVEDYRKIDGVSMPHRVRAFMFANPSGMLSAKFVATEVKVNGSVAVPTQLQIPPGTSVHDELTGKRYRQPAAKPKSTQEPPKATIGSSDSTTINPDIPAEGKPIDKDKLLDELRERDAKFSQRSLELERTWDTLTSPRGMAAEERFQSMKYGQADPGIPEGLPDDYQQTHRIRYIWTGQNFDSTLEILADLETAIHPEHGKLESRSIESDCFSYYRYWNRDLEIFSHSSDIAKLRGGKKAWEYLLPSGIGFTPSILSVSNAVEVDDGYMLKGLVSLPSATIGSRKNCFEIHLDKELILRKAVIQYHVYDFVIATSGRSEFDEMPPLAKQAAVSIHYVGQDEKRSGDVGNYKYEVISLSDRLNKAEYDLRVNFAIPKGTKLSAGLNLVEVNLNGLPGVTQIEHDAPAPRPEMTSNEPNQPAAPSVDDVTTKEHNDAANADLLETGNVVLHAMDADTGEPIRNVVFVKENLLREDWAIPVGSSDADGMVQIDLKPLPGYFFSILPVPQGYKVTSLDDVPAQVKVGGRVEYRFHLRKLGTNLDFVKEVPEPKSAGNRFADTLKDSNNDRFQVGIDDMPGFRDKSVTFSFARENAPLAERIFASGELVRAAVHDELRYFQKAEEKLAGNISELSDIKIVISDSTLPNAPTTSWDLYCRTKDCLELKQDGFKIRFEGLDLWDLEIPAFLHPEF